jgi:protein transport protein SEC61 subunit gamma-like protein
MLTFLSFFFVAEFARIARATGIGFLIMGFVGFFVKIVHIPINNILMGGKVM